MVSSKLDGKFPQRDYHVYRELRKLGCKVRLVKSYNLFAGFFGVLKYRRVKCKVFSGFRAGVFALFLKPFIGWYFYDLVEWKADLCRDNWAGLKRILVPLIEWVEMMIVRNARAVFNAGKLLIHPSLNGRRVVFAENGYNDELFNPKKYDRPSIRKKYNVDFPLIIYIGKLTSMYVKYLVPVIDAMELVREKYHNAEFWIVGDGGARTALERYARGRKGIRLKGYVPYEQVPEFVVMADVGVNAYRTESLKLREWLAMGLPTIAPLEVKFPGVVNCKWTREEIAKTITKILESGKRFRVRLNTWSDTARVIASTCKEALSS